MTSAPPFATPGAALAHMAAERGADEALAFPHRDARLTFAAWQEQATTLARGLRTRGLGAGDHVALLAENRIEWPVVQLAVALIGGVLVPLNTHYGRDELSYALEQSDSRALIRSDGFRGHDYAGSIADIRADLPLLAHDISLDDGGYAAVLAAGAGSDVALPEVAADDFAALLYTSGTTGVPKGAVLTHRAMLTDAWISTQRLRVRPGDRWTSMIPLFHCSGSIFNILGCLVSGAAFIGVSGFDPAEMCALVEAERCTGFTGVPTAYVAMLRYVQGTRHDLSSLRVGVSGGAGPDPAVLRGCEKNLPIGALVQLYGLTETSTAVTIPAPDSPRRCENAGPPLDGVGLRIAEPDSNAALPADQIGEIQVRGPTVMSGYYKMPDATAAAFASDGWLKTGDLGYLDAAGELHVSAGRLKDMLIRGGENVYPAEIERALHSHFAVGEAAVFGLPDDYYGEVPAAALRLDAIARAEDLAAYCAERLAGYKVPVRFFTVESFPTNAGGKIRKDVLRERALAGQLTDLE